MQESAAILFELLSAFVKMQSPIKINPAIDNPALDIANNRFLRSLLIIYSSFCAVFARSKSKLFLLLIGKICLIMRNFGVLLPKSLNPVFMNMPVPV